MLEAKIIFMIDTAPPPRPPPPPPVEIVELSSDEESDAIFFSDPGSVKERRYVRDFCLIYIHEGSGGGQ